MMCVVVIRKKCINEHFRKQAESILAADPKMVIALIGNYLDQLFNVNNKRFKCAVLVFNGDKDAEGLALFLEEK